MTYRTKRILSLVLLLVGLPVYIVLAVTIVGRIDRPHIVLEVAIYLVLGFLWALPFKAVFKGVGRADPDLPPNQE
ncbi:MAG TPA: DUF2842 domain-containing protein [Thermohalobaculum sp.]|nr:DUF2842 domain-containing protein [Thermohalobaculum sp.]